MMRFPSVFEHQCECVVVHVGNNGTNYDSVCL